MHPHSLSFEMMRAICLIAAALILFPFDSARAQKFGADALVDFGFALPSGQTSFNDGGLGKLEYSRAPAPVGQALADFWGQLSPSLDLKATLRLAPNQRAPFDILEAYARYRPVDTQSWVWSIKTGAFFPPISLENEGIGWTSPWTLTSSAINTWVGDELRTIGGETTVEKRYRGGSVGFVGAVFAANDPAGALLADRGWVFDGRPSGLLGEPRRPDIVASEIGLAIPAYEEPFKEIDGQPGWYAGLSLRQDGIGRLQALYYDNRADPSTYIGDDFAWRTRFGSFGAEADIGDVVLLSQAMFGQTAIEPFEGFYSTTDFQSAYLLAGYSISDYRIAARADVFATQQHNTGGNGPGEHGYALTLAATWSPIRWFHLTGELLHVDSDREQRVQDGLPVHASQLQAQLVGRVLF
jgi:hypothetical protein